MVFGFARQNVFDLLNHEIFAECYCSNSSYIQGPQQHLDYTYKKSYGYIEKIFVFWKYCRKKNVKLLMMIIAYCSTCCTVLATVPFPSFLHPSIPLRSEKYSLMSFSIVTKNILYSVGWSLVSPAS
jgi:hypothetical protein